MVVLECDATLGEKLSSELRAAGASQVAMVYDGREALEEIDRLRPDLLIVDFTHVNADCELSPLDTVYLLNYLINPGDIKVIAIGDDDGLPEKAIDAFVPSIGETPQVLRDAIERVFA